MDNNRINYEDLNIEKELENYLIEEALWLHAKVLDKTIKSINGINKKNLNPLEAEEISMTGFFKERQLKNIKNILKTEIVSLDDCNSEQIQCIYYALCELKETLDENLHSDFPTKEGVGALYELYERQVIMAKKTACERLIAKITQIQKCGIK